MTKIAHLYLCYLVLQKLASVFLKCNNFVTKSSIAVSASPSMNLSREDYSIQFKTRCKWTGKPPGFSEKAIYARL
jgi:hypothetical protein